MPEIRNILCRNAKMFKRQRAHRKPLDLNASCTSLRYRLSELKKSRSHSAGGARERGLQRGPHDCREIAPKWRTNKWTRGKATQHQEAIAFPYQALHYHLFGNSSAKGILQIWSNIIHQPIRVLPFTGDVSVLQFDQRSEGFLSP